VPEQDVTRAQLAQAEVEVGRAATNLARDEAQFRIGGIARAQLDDTRSAHASAQARVAQLRSELTVAQLPSRTEQIQAQSAQVAAARAALEQATWRLDQKAVKATKAGRVYDTLYREGEWVAAGAPVVRMLPPANVKVRFFVPQTVVGTLGAGRAVAIQCDGCGADIPAAITYVLQRSGVHAAHHLQQRDAQQARVHGRGTAFRGSGGQAAPGAARVRDAEMNEHDGSAVIDVHGLNKSFGAKRVVVDLSMRVMQGEIFGFLGPNGSGKTTSIRLMCGLLTPDSGSGTCLGYDIRTQSELIKRNVGYMTQRFSFWEDLTIRENLEFTARVYAMDDRKAAVDGALDDLGLGSRQHQLTGTLSGGWKQRLALAACMLHRPRLLLLDEPTAGVDPNARREFWEELHRLAAQGISVLVSTHYMDEAERCHKLAYIAYGRLLVQGTANEVIAAQGLTTFSVRGPDLNELTERLRTLPGRRADRRVRRDGPRHRQGRRAARAHAARRVRGRRLRHPAHPTGLEDVFIHLMQARPTTSATVRNNNGCILVRALVGDGHEGVPAAPARSRHLRHDRRHSHRAAHALRLRDQHRSEAHADRADRRRQQRVHAHLRAGR
jgi:ABC-2 type transport system ATP-binding protein